MANKPYFNSYLKIQKQFKILRGKIVYSDGSKKGNLDDLFEDLEWVLSEHCVSEKTHDIENLIVRLKNLILEADHSIINQSKKYL